MRLPTQTAIFAVALLFAAAAPIEKTRIAGDLQLVVEEIKRDLSIPQNVTVSVVPANPLLVSVEPVRGQADAFQLTVEEGFFDRLNDDEVRAAIAHELGHVWIFTHHPFLQTERGANQIAMRVVTREALRDVYLKVWQGSGVKGELARFLGP